MNIEYVDQRNQVSSFRDFVVRVCARICFTKRRKVNQANWNIYSIKSIELPFAETNREAAVGEKSGEKRSYGAADILYHISRGCHARVSKEILMSHCEYFFLISFTYLHNIVRRIAGPMRDFLRVLVQFANEF